jgi:hypothetical protein
MPVNALRLVVGFLLQVGYKQNGRIIPKVSDCLIQLDVHSMDIRFDIQVPHRSQFPYLRQRPLASSFPQHVHVSFESM